MFSGIVGATAKVVAIENLGAGKYFGRRLLIQAPSYFCDDLVLGASIALNGACMTVTDYDKAKSCFSIEISQESISKTVDLVLGQMINLEKSLRLGDSLDGHLVTGHVDGVARVITVATIGESLGFCLTLPAQFAQFIAKKGSIAIAGVSLTVNEVKDVGGECVIDVNVIAYTAEHTILGKLKSGDHLNFEVDPLARYCARLATVMQEKR